MTTSPLIITITIIFILAIIATVIVYFRDTVKYYRSYFDSLSKLLQTIFIFIALWISVYTILSTNQNTEKLFENLEGYKNNISEIGGAIDELSHKLKELPVQIDNFSNSIDTLNRIVINQSDNYKTNTKTLNSSVNNFSSSLNMFEENINKYNNQLNKIVESTDKQLEIWKEQQSILLDEFSRKPILNMYFKDTTQTGDSIKINEIILENSGNIEANIRTIFIFIPQNILLDAEQEKFKKYRKVDQKQSFRLIAIGTTAEIISAKSKIEIPFDVSLSEINRRITYRIDYFSKYISGMEQNTVKLKMNKNSN